MTPDQIIFHRRVRAIEYPEVSGNVSETCRVFEISRTTFYEWRNLAEGYGLDALMPKGRRRPQMPNATPTHVVEEILTLAVMRPTLGCRRYADELEKRGYAVSKTTVQKILVDHGLGRRSHRVARAAALAALTAGLVTEAAVDDELFEFCQTSGRSFTADRDPHSRHHPWSSRDPTCTRSGPILSSSSTPRTFTSGKPTSSSHMRVGSVSNGALQARRHRNHRVC